MYVSINLNHMRLMHKHADRTVIADLAWIEAHNDAYEIADLTARGFLSGRTDMELKLLYRNMTGADSYYGGSYLRAIIAELCERAPFTEADKIRAAAQSAYVDKDMPHFRYVHGSSIPSRGILLWSKEESLKAEKSSDEATNASRRYKSYEPAGGVPTYSARIAPEGIVQAPRSAGGAGQAVAQPRQSGVRERIHSAANEAWESAGRPTDKVAVLALRKRIMDDLEAQGIKRNSASNELGVWQRICIPDIR